MDMCSVFGRRFQAKPGRAEVYPEQESSRIR
jgi:hypothetical protein